MAKLILALVMALAVSSTLAAPRSSKVAYSLQQKVNRGIPANIIVTVRGSVQPILRSFKGRSFTTRAEKITTLKSLLEANAAETQQSILSALSTFPFIEIKSFWITNKIHVSGLVTAQLVNRLAAMDEVEEIREEIIVPIDEPINYSEDNSVSPMAEWGIDSIRAPEAWALNYTGQNARVATIDTGVRQSHQSLASRYLGSYGWFDPYQRTSAPNDQNGHGTHTTGTIAGSNNIGVAPGATWMACKGCGSSSCGEAELIACGEFVFCPTWTDGSNADCSQAPDVSSNSWGGGQGDAFYNDVTDSWISVDIIPVFAIGNSGPLCSTANSPGDQEVISVGASTAANGLALFSSKGPSIEGLVKPDISAPGENIRSASNIGDGAYAANSGTSMACPHVAGVVALVKSIDNTITYEEIKTLLYGTASKGLTPTARNCGGIDTSTFPNNSYGYGKVDALSAVQAAVRRLAAKK